ncbi:MAG: P-II family nitrogen regulator [Deltaproteobacteria bacterium]|nr:P-II family nitrogen regulator [Deltaproteobacteria bacterium]
MKYVIAIIRPDRLDEVQRALLERDIYLMTISEVRGCGRQRGAVEQVRGRQMLRMVDKIKLEMAVNDEFVDAAVDAITLGARTGETGDGKIFVLPLEECVHVRTGTSGPSAIGP